MSGIKTEKTNNKEEERKRNDNVLLQMANMEKEEKYNQRHTDPKLS